MSHLKFELIWQPASMYYKISLMNLWAIVIVQYTLQCAVNALGITGYDRSLQTVL